MGVAQDTIKPFIVKWVISSFLPEYFVPDGINISIGAEYNYKKKNSISADIGYILNIKEKNNDGGYLTMGHERVHVMDYYYGRLNPYNETSTKRSEIRAYNWDFMQCMKFRLQSDPYYGIKMPVETLNEYIKLENKYGYNTKMYDY